MKPTEQTTLTEEQAADLRAILVEKARAARERGNLELARFFMSRVEPYKDVCRTTARLNK